MPAASDRLNKTLLILLISCSAIGCRDTSGRLAVSGKVTYDGQPVTNGSIGLLTSDISSGKSVGADIVDGQYEIPRDEGPLAGSYKVVISAERPSGRELEADEGSTEMIDQLVQYIPEIYNARSTLTVEISGDRDDLNFELEKPKRTRRRRR